MVNSTAGETNGYWLKSLVNEMLFRKELKFPTDRRDDPVNYLSMFFHFVKFTRFVKFTFIVFTVRVVSGKVFYSPRQF
jgi:hypothetical protein